MTEFEKILEQWNNGVFRGAKAKLSKEIDVSEVTVSRWAKGELKPGREAIQKMSALFNKSISDIEKLFSANTEFSPSVRMTPLTDKNTISLPILADVPAGLPEFSDKDVETFWDIPRWVFPGADFVVKCNGDSLEPKLHQGDYCVIRKTTDPIHGRAMVVRTENGVCMKVINKLKDGTIQLCSTNPKYKPFTPQELTIIGLIIGSWSRQDKENWLGISYKGDEK